MYRFPPEDLQCNILTNGAGCREEMEEEVPSSQDTEMESKPSFGAPPDFDSDQFDFKKELERLPFPINIGEAPLNLEQQKTFHQINL